MKQMEKKHHPFTEKIQSILKEDLKIEEEGKKKEWNKVLGRF